MTNKKLTALNDATKFNLRNYLSYYRILTDAINIKNGYIVNIGVDFEIVVNQTTMEMMFSKMYSENKRLF